MVEIVLNEKSYHLDFSLKVIRALGRKWGHKTVHETLQKIGTIDKISEMDLDAFDLFYEILEMAINKCSLNELKITIDELEDMSIAQLTEISSKMTVGLMDSFQSDEVSEVKKIPAPKKK